MALYYCPPILLLINILYGEFGRYSGGDIPIYYTRNWLFLGLPCFFIGQFVKCYATELSQNINLTLSIALIVLGILIYYIELGYTNNYADLYIGSIFLAYGFLLASVSIKTKESILSKIGSRDSLYLYLLHPIVLDLFSIANGHMSTWWSNVYSYLAPIIVIIFVEMMIDVLRKIKILS